MATVSKKIQIIKRELQALKIGFARSARQIPLTTKTLSFNTKKNACHFEDRLNPGFDYNYEDDERVIVTLNTTQGTNTLAILEISGNYDLAPVVKRLPYSGGARWSVTTSPRYDWNDHSWLPTTYNFTIQTLVDGSMSARMEWEA